MKFQISKKYKKLYKIRSFYSFDFYFLNKFPLFFLSLRYFCRFFFQKKIFLSQKNFHKLMNLMYINHHLICDVFLNNVRLKFTVLVTFDELILVLFKCYSDNVVSYQQKFKIAVRKTWKIDLWLNKIKLFFVVNW